MKSTKGPRKAPAKRKAATSGSAQEGLTSAPAVEEIRIRAYEIYIERGGTDGQALEDWLQAEKELARGIRKRRSD